jgi:hypothetical protein
MDFGIFNGHLPEQPVHTLLYGNQGSTRKLLKGRWLTDIIVGEVRQLAKAVQSPYRWGRYP